MKTSVTFDKNIKIRKAGTCSPILLLLSILLFLLWVNSVRAQKFEKSTDFNQSRQQNNFHPTTDWQIRPSFKLDVLCFLNTLTGDPYYLDEYKEEFSRFESKITPEARTALADLKRKIKDNKKGIISAFLTLRFSVTEDETLDEMLGTLNNTNNMESKFKLTTYYDAEGWQLFESVKNDLKTIFLFLKQIRFDEYWKQNILPIVNCRINAIQRDLPFYNLVSEIENHLGFPLESNKITVFMLYYNKPHGIKITGTRFITSTEWGLRTIVRNSVHEMMHPPYNLSKSPELKQAIDTLKSDQFLMDKVLNHNPSFGYNSLEGFIEEDSVQALEQLVTEKLKIQSDPRWRWKNSDAGMHVFAVALYQVMKEENYGQRRENFGDFLVKAIRSGKLSAGRIKPIYDSFYPPSSK